MTTKSLFNIAVRFVLVAILAIAIDASFDSFVIGLTAGWFIIFLWSKRP